MIPSFLILTALAPRSLVSHSSAFLLALYHHFSYHYCACISSGFHWSHPPSARKKSGEKKDREEKSRFLLNDTRVIGVAIALWTIGATSVNLVTLVRPPGLEGEVGRRLPQGLSISQGDCRIIANFCM